MANENDLPFVENIPEVLRSELGMKPPTVQKFILRPYQLRILHAMREAFAFDPSTAMSATAIVDAARLDAQSLAEPACVEAQFVSARYRARTGYASLVAHGFVSHRVENGKSFAWLTAAGLLASMGGSPTWAWETLLGRNSKT